MGRMVRSTPFFTEITLTIALYAGLAVLVLIAIVQALTFAALRQDSEPTPPISPDVLVRLGSVETDLVALRRQITELETTIELRHKSLTQHMLLQGRRQAKIDEAAELMEQIRATPLEPAEVTEQRRPRVVKR